MLRYECDCEGDIEGPREDQLLPLMVGGLWEEGEAFDLPFCWAEGGSFGGVEVKGEVLE